MKVVIENSKVEKEVNHGDLVKVNNNDMTYMIVKADSKYAWLNLETGFLGMYRYDSIDELLVEEFEHDRNMSTIFSSDDYTLKLVKKV